MDNLDSENLQQTSQCSAGTIDVAIEGDPERATEGSKNGKSHQEEEKDLDGRRKSSVLTVTKGENETLDDDTLHALCRFTTAVDYSQDNRSTLSDSSDEEMTPHKIVPHLAMNASQRPRRKSKKGKIKSKRSGNNLGCTESETPPANEPLRQNSQLLESEMIEVLWDTFRSAEDVWGNFMDVTIPWFAPYS